MKASNCLSFIAFFFLFHFTYAQVPDTALARKLLLEAGVLFDSAKYEQSLALSETVTNMFLENGVEKREQLANSYLMKGKALSKKGIPHQEQSFYQKALEIYEGKKVSNHPDLANLYF